MRHYSKVLIEFPDSPSDPQELIVHMDCDTCGEHEWRTHVAHFGTLVRVLNEAYQSLGGDGGSTQNMKLPEGADLRKAREHLDRHFPEWKAKRIRSEA